MAAQIPSTGICQDSLSIKKKGKPLHTNLIKNNLINTFLIMLLTARVSSDNNCRRGGLCGWRFMHLNLFLHFEVLAMQICHFKRFIFILSR